jgi:hypothetical protein
MGSPRLRGLAEGDAGQGGAPRPPGAGGPGGGGRRGLRPLGKGAVRGRGRAGCPYSGDRGPARGRAAGDLPLHPRLPDLAGGPGRRGCLPPASPFVPTCCWWMRTGWPIPAGSAWPAIWASSWTCRPSAWPRRCSWVPRSHRVRTGEDRGPLLHEGEVVGATLRTRAGVAPVYVSTGHRISLETALRWTLTLPRDSASRSPRAAPTRPRPRRARCYHERKSRPAMNAAGDMVALPDRGTRDPRRRGPGSHAPGAAGTLRPRVRARLSPTATARWGSASDRRSRSPTSSP